MGLPISALAHELRAGHRGLLAILVAIGDLLDPSQDPEVAAQNWAETKRKVGF